MIEPGGHWKPSESCSTRLEAATGLIAAKQGSMSTSPASQQRRGWVAFGAGAFLVVLMGAIWIWVDQLLFAQGDVAAAQLAGRLNVAFALIVIAGVLGAINGWITAHSGRTVRILVFGAVVLFIGALAIAWRASSG
jgi:hypothetical protein